MFLQTLSCSFNYYVIKYVLYYNTFFEKFKGFYKTFIIKVIFRFSATFFTSPSPSLPQPPSPENMSPISPPSYSLSSPSHSPHTGKIQFHVLFLCIKSAPFFLLSALKNLRKPDACPGEKSHPQASFHQLSAQSHNRLRSCYSFESAADFSTPFARLKDFVSCL